MSSSRDTDLDVAGGCFFSDCAISPASTSAAPFLLFVVHHEGESHLSTIPRVLTPTSDRQVKTKAQE